MLDAERALGLDTPAYYERFADRVRQCNSTGVDLDLIAYVVDRSTHKQGKLMPGCRLPIRPVEVLVDSPPDDVLLLAWNFAEEIIAQQGEYLARGGTFHVPVPMPRAVVWDREGAVPAGELA
jgi:hypothetical protein